MRPQFAASSTKDINFKQVVSMMSQNATSSQSKRQLGLLPYAFTEHGVTMLASVLKSERAVKMSIAVVRAFIELKKSALQYSGVIAQIKLLRNCLKMIFRISYNCKSGRWGHRPRRAAPVGIPANRRQIEMHPTCSAFKYLLLPHGNYFY